MQSVWWIFYNNSSTIVKQTRGAFAPLVSHRRLLEVVGAERHTPDTTLHHRRLEDEVGPVGDLVVVDLALAVRTEPPDLDGVARLLGVLDHTLDGGRLGEAGERGAGVGRSHHRDITMGEIL